jgi:hypothetical protein
MVKFVGKPCGHNEVRNDPEKGKIIDSLPEKPTSLKDVRSLFLGMASWHFREFAPEYINLAATITHKFRGLPEKFKFDDIWDDEAQTAYCTKLSRHSVDVN